MKELLAPEPPQLEMICELAEAQLQFTLPAGYSLRAYRPGDEAAWVEIMRRTLSSNMTQEHAQKTFFGSHEFHGENVFFAVRDGAPVGTAAAWREPDRWLDDGVLHMVGVLPEHQRMGLGKALSIRVLQHFQEQRKERVFLLTDDHRLPAIRAYLRIGFRPVLRTEEFRRRWDVIADQMGIRLSGPDSEVMDSSHRQCRK